MKFYSYPTYCILISFFISIQCASIQKLENIQYKRPTPVIREVKFGWTGTVENVDDYKLRIKNKIQPDIGILFPEENWNPIPEKDKGFIQQEIYAKLLKISGVRFHWLKKEPDFHEKKLKDLDGILVFQWKERENSSDNSIEAILKDPILDKVYFQDWIFVHFPPTKDEQRIVYLNQSNLILPPIGKPSPELDSNFPGNQWKDAILQTVHGSLSIYASSLDTTVYINGNLVGEVPIQDYSIPNGIQVLEFHRPGLEPIKKSIQIRAGKNTRVIHEWEGDRTTASLSLLSFPSGLEVWVDGTKKGNTQYYESDLPEGDLRVRWSKIWKEKNLEQEFLYKEEDVVLEEGKTLSIALPYNFNNMLKEESSEFWQLIGEQGIEPIYNPNLGFKKKAGKFTIGEVGYVSSNIVRSDLVWEGSFADFNSKKGEFIIGIVGTDKAVAIGVHDSNLAIYEWSLSSPQRTMVSLSAWKYKENTKPEKRNFQFQIETKKDNQELTLYLGNKKVFQTQAPAGKFWRLLYSTRSDRFWNGSPVESMRIVYPDLFEFDRKKEKESYK